MNDQPGQIDCPWVTFRLGDGNYCVSSQHIETMTTEGRFYPLPDTDAYLRGVLDLNGRMLPVVDLRILLGMEPREAELDVFREMRQAHVNWVETLERCVKTQEPFTLAEDPHQCAFGRWYDHYETEHYEVRSVLNRIGGPHERLHGCAARIREAAGPEQTQALLEEAKSICHGQMLPLLDQLVDSFRAASRGITIVLERAGRSLGLLVDQVTAIRNLSTDEGCGYSEKLGDSRFISRIITDGDGAVFLDLDVDALMAL